MSKKRIKNSPNKVETKSNEKQPQGTIKIKMSADLGEVMPDRVTFVKKTLNRFISENTASKKEISVLVAMMFAVPFLNRMGRNVVLDLHPANKQTVLTVMHTIVEATKCTPFVVYTETEWNYAKVRERWIIRVLFSDNKEQEPLNPDYYTVSIGQLQKPVYYCEDAVVLLNDFMLTRNTSVGQEYIKSKDVQIPLLKWSELGVRADQIQLGAGRMKQCRRTNLSVLCYISQCLYDYGITEMDVEAVKQYAVTAFQEYI